MTLAKPSAVSQTEIYWFDDEGKPRRCTGAGIVETPYKEGDQWKPIETGVRFGVAKDGWNRVTFKPVTTTGLRLEVVMQAGAPAGLQEWRVK